MFKIKQEPRLYRFRGIYHIRFYDQRSQKHKTVSLRTRNRNEANYRFREISNLYSRGAYDPWQDSDPTTDVTLALAIDAYLSSRKGVSKATFANDKQALLYMGNRIGLWTKIKSVTRADVEPIVFRSDVAPSTRETTFIRLKAFFNWCEEQKLLIANPFDGVPKPRKQKRLPAYFTKEEFSYLVSNMSRAWLKDITIFGVYTGMRLGEILNVEWSHVDTQNEFVYVVQGADFQTKSMSDRAIPMSESLKAHLNTIERTGGKIFLKNGKPPTIDNTTKSFKKELRALNLREELHFHSLRHTFGSWLFQAGTPIQYIQQWMGHKDISTTQIYSQMHPDVGKKEINKISF